MNGLFDTSVVLDYLRGVKPADAVFDRFAHRAITVTSWIEVMHAAPERLRSQTREFLRVFQCIEISAEIADHALTLMKKHPRIEMQQAIPWAAAQLRSRVFVTIDFPRVSINEQDVWVPYRPRG